MNRQELARKVKDAVGAVIAEKGHVSAVDLLMRMNILSQKDYEAWRLRKIPYLEKVLNGNLGKISFVLRTFVDYAQNHCRLKPSWTAYNSWGKGPKNRLRFSKYGVEAVERAYATHFVLPVLNKEGKINGADPEIKGRTPL